MFETILVAIDQSDRAQRVLSMAEDLAKCAGGKVRIVHVRELSSGKFGPVPKESANWAVSFVDEAVKAMEADGLVATGVVRDSDAGRVASAILDEAADSDASVIVLGARGLTDLEALVVGSTTHKVLHLGTLPVLVVR
jgi:nucleotide-binding universal stress UspA family protein